MSSKPFCQKYINVIAVKQLPVLTIFLPRELSPGGFLVSKGYIIDILGSEEYYILS